MARSIRLALPFVFVGFALIACGGKSFEEGGEPNGGTAGSSTAGTESEGGNQNVSGTHTGGASGGGTHAGGTGSGGSHAGGTGSGGSHTGGSGTGGTSTAGAGGTSSCADYDNQTGPTIAILITNDTSVPLYLGARMMGCGTGAPFQVADATGTPLVDPPFCTATCQDVMQGTLQACPPIACPIQAPVTLLPGQATMTQWSGLFAVDETLSKQCLPAGANAACTRIVSAKPGNFIFSAQAGSALDCSQFQGGQCPACMPSGTGGCYTPGAIVVGATHSAEAKVKLDASYGVGATGGGGMIQPVQINFKD